jgi:hypothetical protein
MADYRPRSTFQINQQVSENPFATSTSFVPEALTPIDYSNTGTPTPTQNFNSPIASS